MRNDFKNTFCEINLWWKLRRLPAPDHLSTTISVGTPLCLYVIACCRAYGLSTSDCFREFFEVRCVACLGVNRTFSVSQTCSVNREIGNLLPNNQRQRRTFYTLCHILYPMSAAHASIFRMASNSTPCCEARITLRL